ncbi:uncharacterized protein LOC126780097 [Nymphalis io]|uniref:uncharacterized protein LOC126780097 n=1 Tax=Inachis io TaxID=171585 RepID=UPI0021681663|nr:uncharacterized protein LOC126780097 [Nymphalis io]
MAHTYMQRPLVPGRPVVPGQGGGHGKGGAGGAKNPRVTVGRQHRLTLATYNGRTLRLDEHLAQLEEQLRNIRLHILGLCEIRRKGEDTIALESGHFMYFREGDQPSVVRRDLQNSNTRSIKEAIEQNRGSKVLVQKLGRSHLTKLTTSKGKVVASKLEILKEVQDFYVSILMSYKFGLINTKSKLSRAYSNPFHPEDDSEEDEDAAFKYDSESDKFDEVKVTKSERKLKINGRFFDNIMNKEY